MKPFEIIEFRSTCERAKYCGMILDVKNKYNEYLFCLSMDVGRHPNYAEDNTLIAVHTLAQVNAFMEGWAQRHIHDRLGVEK